MASLMKKLALRIREKNLKYLRELFSVMHTDKKPFKPKKNKLK